MKVVGTGLACLDIINKEEETIIMNGGTCANVLTVLAQLGEDVGILLPDYINDKQNVQFYDTFVQMNVHIFKYCTTRHNIPRIIESYDRDHMHVFYTNCPQCHKDLIKSKLINANESNSIMDLISEYDVFFIDRISDGIKNIAAYFNNNGGKVFYEPNSGRNLNAVINMSKMSNIVKFSTDKININMARMILEQCENSKLDLVIATQGEKGLKFSYKNADGVFTDWLNGPYVEFEVAKDTSGAGDWLTAGFLHFWAKEKFELREKTIISALEKGLHLSALCSTTEGAQGPLYDDMAFGILKDNYNIKLANKLDKLVYNKNLDKRDFCMACLLECTGA